MSNPSFSRRFRAGWWLLAGWVPLLVGFLLYRFAVLVDSQIGTVRALGVLAVADLVALAVLAVGAALVAATGLDVEALERRLRPLLMVGAVVNLAAVGLAIKFLSPFAAPRTWQYGTLAAIAVLAIAFFRYREENRAFVAGALRKLGLAALAVPLLASPVVVVGAFTDKPRLTPPPGPVPLRADAPKRIVLVTYDALRARSATPEAMPALAAIAREGTAFDHCIASSDRTRLAMPAMLSGIAPQDFGPFAKNKCMFVRRGAVTGLAGHLSAAGYESYYATQFVDPSSFGMGEEFKAGTTRTVLFRPSELNAPAFLPLAEVAGWLRRDFWTMGTTKSAETGNELEDTRAAFDQGVKYLQGAAGPTFLWVHVAVPHAPYFDVPAADIGKPLRSSSYKKVTVRQALYADAEAARRYEQMYEGYVRYGDWALGRFVASLKAEGLWDDTLLVVTADHGESFKPGAMTHSVGDLSEDIAHVPLVIRDPARRKAARVPTTVSQLDIAPTILARTFQKTPSWLPGVSLLGPLPENRLVYAWAPPDGFKVEDWTLTHAIAAYQDGYKYLENVEEGRGALYAIRTDPLETRNLAASQPERTTRLKHAAIEDLGLNGTAE